MKPVLRMLIKAIFNPITLINIFAPILILQINFLKLKDLLKSDKYANDELFSSLKGLVNDNKWADTLVDVNIQYVVLLVAFLFTIVQSVSGIITILKNHKVGEIIDKWSDNSGALMYLAVSLFIIIGGILVFLSGMVMSPEQINLYRLNSEHPLFTVIGIHAPPPTSYIFIFRTIISIYAVYLTYFLKNTLPEMLNEKAT